MEQYFCEREFQQPESSEDVGYILEEWKTVTHTHLLGQNIVHKSYTYKKNVP